MATIIRIKRRLDDESAENLVVASKRAKTEKTIDVAIENDVEQTLLKRISTVTQKAEAFDASHISKLVRHAEYLREDYKKTPKHNIKEKVKKSRNDQRYKIVSALRKSSIKIEVDDSNVHIVDIEQHMEDFSNDIMNKDENTCNGVPINVENDSFVYDLYVVQDTPQLSDWTQNICEIRAYNASELVHDVSDDVDIMFNSSDDEENEEGYDYPDEDEDHILYEDEDDFLSKQMQKAKLYDTDESYDFDDYDEDFDEDGKLFNTGLSSAVFGFKIRAAHLRYNSDSSDDSDEDFPDF